MPERPPKPVALTDHINELEALIDARKPPVPGAQVPILDDVVEPVPGGADGNGPGPDSAALESRLLRRLDTELAELATVIREIVRRCIREELAPDVHDRPPPAKPGDD
ncbi:MAG TPA: hypothetical protein VIC61_00410 [Gammaproteobacteria bacterium]|jgi:hypothetical protein